MEHGQLTASGSWHNRAIAQALDHSIERFEGRLELTLGMTVTLPLRHLDSLGERLPRLVPAALLRQKLAGLKVSRRVVRMTIQQVFKVRPGLSRPVAR